MDGKRLLQAKTMVLVLALAVTAQEISQKPDATIGAFWKKFQAAVGRRDKAAVVAMADFPLTMPYGVGSIRTRAQLTRSYNKIFDAETRRCFATATPQVESGKRKQFSISCGEAMMYWFEFRNGAYKFIGVDNVNE